jgi:hypothetical protein
MRVPRPALEVADIFRAHGPVWRDANECSGIWRRTRPAAVSGAPERGSFQTLDAADPLFVNLLTLARGRVARPSRRRSLAQFIQGGTGRFFLRRKSGLKSLD